LVPSFYLFPGVVPAPPLLRSAFFPCDDVHFFSRVPTEVFFLWIFSQEAGSRPHFPGDLFFFSGIEDMGTLLSDIEEAFFFRLVFFPSPREVLLLCDGAMAFSPKSGAAFFKLSSRRVFFSNRAAFPSADHAAFFPLPSAKAPFFLRDLSEGFFFLSSRHFFFQRRKTIVPLRKEELFSFPRPRKQTPLLGGGLSLSLEDGLFLRDVRFLKRTPLFFFGNPPINSRPLPGWNSSPVIFFGRSASSLRMDFPPSRRKIFLIRDASFFQPGTSFCKKIFFKKLPQEDPCPFFPEGVLFSPPFVLKAFFFESRGFFLSC